jgi:hypothetical protein
VFEKRHDFAEWCDRQSCTAETVAELAAIAESAPPQAREWMAVEWSDAAPRRPVAFSNHHVVMLARKPRS